MEIFLYHIISALAFSFILFVLASGLSLIFGVMGIINIAHGAMYTLGAFIGITIAKSTGSFWAGALLSAICIGFVGLIVERVFLGRLYKQLDAQVLLSIGLVFIIGNAIVWIWGAWPLMGKVPPMLSGILQIGNFGLPVYRVAIIVVGLIFYLGMWWLQDKTRAGAMVRAGMDDKEMTSGLGVNYALVSTMIFTLGTIMGGLAGFLGSPILGVWPEMSISIVFLSFVVIVVGGVGSVHGALLGSIVIGLADNLGKAYLPDFALFIIYLIFILVLIIKPTGLLGRKEFATEGVYIPIKKPFNMEQFGRLFEYLPYSLFAAGIVILLLTSSNYVGSLAAKAMIFAIFAMSLNLLSGYTGMLSLGHAAYFGVSGYMTAILVVHAGIDNFWITFPLSILLSGVTAAVFGIIALRVSGGYFLLVTMGLGELLYSLATKWRNFSGGENGLPGVTLPDLKIPGLIMNNNVFHFLVFIVFLVCLFLIYRFIKSPYGLVLQGIRDNEPRMRALGYNTWRYKYSIFILAGIFAGVAGALYAHWGTVLVPIHLGTATSIVAVVIGLLGGTRLVFGPVLGAILLVSLEQITSIVVPERWPLVLGAIFVITVMFLRSGTGDYLLRLWGKAYKHIWKY